MSIYDQVYYILPALCNTSNTSHPIIPGPVRPGRGQLAGGGPLHARAQPLQPAALRRGGRGCRQVGLASQPLPLLRF